MGVVFVVIIGLIFLIVFLLISPDNDSERENAFLIESKLASLTANIISDSSIKIKECKYASLPYMLSYCLTDESYGECSSSDLVDLGGESYCDAALIIINDTLLWPIFAEQFYNYSMILSYQNGTMIKSISNGECTGERFSDRYPIVTSGSGTTLNLDLTLCR